MAAGPCSRSVIPRRVDTGVDQLETLQQPIGMIEMAFSSSKRPEPSAIGASRLGYSASQGLGLDASNTCDSIKPAIPGHDLGQLQMPHQHRMIGICEGEVALHVQVEHLLEPPLAGQDDAGQLDQRQQDIANGLLRLSVEPLEGEVGLEDDGVGRAHLQLAPLDPSEVRRRLWRVLWMILSEMAQQDVRVKERQRRLPVHPLDYIVGDRSLRGSP